VGDGPDLWSCSLRSLNRKSMTIFQPESSRLAPRHPLLRIARKRTRPDFLCAGLNEHRLKVRLRTPQSIVVRPGASLACRRLAAPRTRLRLPGPCFAERTRRCSRTRVACRETRRAPPRRIAIGSNRANGRRSDRPKRRTVALRASVVSPEGAADQSTSGSRADAHTSNER
jgi:hypothetical protein